MINDFNKNIILIVSQLLAGVLAISTPFMLSNISMLYLSEEGVGQRGRGGGGGVGGKCTILGRFLAIS